MSKRDRRTQAYVRAQLKAKGISLRINRAWGEYRVTFANLQGERAEACAYYTDDLGDALLTGLRMAKDREENPQHWESNQ